MRLGVALLVPEPQAGEIDVLRRACGGQPVPPIPPHCTLVPPVNVREDRLDDALARLRSAAAATRPMAATLGPPATFLPVNPVLYLEMGDDAALRQLRDQVFVEPLARPLSWPFQPHVTVVDDGEPERLAAAVIALAGYRVEVTFERLHLLQEERDARGRRVWQPIADATFAAPAVVGRGGLELELSVTERLDPVSARFEEREWAGRDPVGHERPQDLAVTARRDGQVVGAATGWTSGASAHLSRLVVDSAHRGEGIGAQAAAAFLSEAAARGCRLVRVRTEVGGPAEGFWRRLGWVEEARFDAYPGDGDFVQLRRDLA